MDALVDLTNDSDDDDGMEQQEPKERVRIPKEYSEKVYYVVLPGPPKAFPRPEFMSWISRGVLMRRVVNKAKKSVETTRNAIKQYLQQTYKLPNAAFPLCETCRHGVVVFVKFYRRIPNNMFVGNDRTKGLKNQEEFLFDRDQDTKRPDVDNLVKYILECLKGVAYRDDARVVKVQSSKFVDVEYPFNGRTVLKFRDFVPLVDGPYEHRYEDDNGFELFY